MYVRPPTPPNFRPIEGDRIVRDLLIVFAQMGYREALPLCPYCKADRLELNPATALTGCPSCGLVVLDA